MTGAGSLAVPTQAINYPTSLQSLGCFVYSLPVHLHSHKQKHTWISFLHERSKKNKMILYGGFLILQRLGGGGNGETIVKLRILPLPHFPKYQTLAVFLFHLCQNLFNRLCPLFPIMVLFQHHPRCDNCSLVNIHKIVRLWCNSISV